MKEEILQIALLVVCIYLIHLLTKKKESLAAADIPPKAMEDEQLKEYCGNDVDANKAIVAACNSEIGCVLDTKERFDSLCATDIMPGGLLDDSELEELEDDQGIDFEDSEEE